MVRFVVSEARVVPDPRRRLPGRGAYLCAACATDAATHAVRLRRSLRVAPSDAAIEGRGGQGSAEHAASAREDVPTAPSDRRAPQAP